MKRLRCKYDIDTHILNQSQIDKHKIIVRKLSEELSHNILQISDIIKVESMSPLSVHDIAHNPTTRFSVDICVMTTCERDEIVRLLVRLFERSAPHEHDELKEIFKLLYDNPRSEQPTNDIV